LINPSVVQHGEKIVRSEEGCLSYPGIFCKVNRWNSVKIKYYTESFVEETKEFFGSDAFVVQHELEHNLGICFVGDEWKRLRDVKDGLVKPSFKEIIYNDEIFKEKEKNEKPTENTNLSNLPI
jgi:peptide deformylase